MKSKVLVLILVFVSSIASAQVKYLNYGVGYAAFGDGDYSGINFFNNFQFPVSKTFDLKFGVQIVNASELREEYFYHRHNVFNLANNCNLVITPVAIDFFRFSLSAGGIWRYRTEIVFSNSRTVYSASGSPLRMIENDFNKSFDAGYNVDLIASLKIFDRIYSGVCGQFIGYNKGSGLFTLNFYFSYAL